MQETLTQITEVHSEEEMNQLLMDAVKTVKYYIDKANEKLGLKMPYPKVLFNVKGTTAGWAVYREGLIRLNPQLLRQNPQEFIKRTPGHEVGHLAAFSKYGTDIGAHGREWINVMWTLGLDATRCHNYDTSDTPNQARKRKVSSIIHTNEGITRVSSFGKVTQFEE